MTHALTGNILTAKILKFGGTFVENCLKEFCNLIKGIGDLNLALVKTKNRY